jgi:hypothetical protein
MGSILIYPRTILPAKLKRVLGFIEFGMAALESRKHVNIVSTAILISRQYTLGTTFISLFCYKRMTLDALGVE